MPWGKGNKMVAQTMFPQGIGLQGEREQLPGEKGRNFFRGKGTKLL
jgi:hypothetical protein